jgi:predicted DNA-binding transcriptional regulator AlpA
MMTEDPFDGREHDGRVFITRHERLFFIGRLSPSQQKEWLRDHPDRWQTREDFLRDRQVRAGTNVQAKPPEPSSTISATKVPASAGSESQSPVPVQHNRQPDMTPPDTAPQTIADPKATNPATTAAGDEIVIDDRHLLGERRVAEMLGCSPRTLQRWRTEGNGPPSTKIGRKVFYELDGLQEWIDRGKRR